MDIAVELEKRQSTTSTRERKLTQRRLLLRVIYEALNLPPDMFTVMFAIPRTSGWIAQWREMQEDPETKIARPRQIYTGARERNYQAIGDRGDGSEPPRSPEGFTSPVDPSKDTPGGGT